MRLRAALLPVLACVSLAAAYSLHRARPATPTLPAFGTLPPFQLTTERGEPFSKESLTGKVTVLDFIFTNCGTACPLLSQQMAQLQAEVVRRGLEHRIALLSVSVDPERDTPARLHAFAERYGAEPNVWHFLRGDEASLRKVVVDGLLQVMDKVSDKTEKDGFTILHGTRFVLVDNQARIRGFYDANDENDRQRLRTDMVGLAKGAIRLAPDVPIGVKP